MKSQILVPILSVSLTDSGEAKSQGCFEPGQLSLYMKDDIYRPNGACLHINKVTLPHNRGNHHCIYGHDNSTTQVAQVECIQCGRGVRSRPTG